MAQILSEFGLWPLIAATGVVFLSGFVKGVVGFGMPMVLISGLGSIFSPEVALAALILPTLTTNIWQSLRDGWRAAGAVLRRFWLYVVIMLGFLAISAQLVAILPAAFLFIAIGVPILAFALFQLAGRRLALNPAHRTRDEAWLATVSGFVGGMSGVWGPPLVAYLVAIDTEKREAIRIQGVIFLIGALALLAAHLRSGVLNTATLPLSAAAILPAFAGMGIGALLHDRMPQATFRRAVLVVLLLTGANLIRRGVMGA